jgi:subtilisin family serine protease
MSRLHLPRPVVVCGAVLGLASVVLSSDGLAPPSKPNEAAQAAAQVAAVEPARQSYVTDELIVAYFHGAVELDKLEARNEIGGELIEDLTTLPMRDGKWGELELLRLPAGLTPDAAAERLRALPLVRYAERNWIYSHDAVSNDTYYTGGQLWGMYGDATTPANQYGSQAGEAWAVNHTGSSTVCVGVIDEGVMYAHLDLSANIWTNPGEVVDGVDNDGNGYVDDVRGWDFNGNDNTTYDNTRDDHGTHVSGTIGAMGGNARGVVGVCWNVKIITAKFLGAAGGTTANAVQACDYLADLKSRHNLDLVASNNSWGGGGYSQSLYDAIQRANVADILFVAAAGNGGSDGVGDNNDAIPSYPSNYTHANVIAVASITSSGAKSGFSNYGATTVDIAAPGSGIYSTLPANNANKYGSYSGTSMATPHVTGAAALYAASHPGSNAATIKNAILGSAVPTPSMAGRCVTGGRLNVSGF